MITHPLRKFIHKFGIDIQRYRPGPNKLGWLPTYHINTIIDVGANVGQFAQEIRLVLPQAFVYSFEPLLDCYHQLVGNMSGDQKCKAFNVALGDKEGGVSFITALIVPALLFYH